MEALLLAFNYALNQTGNQAPKTALPGSHANAESATQDTLNAFLNTSNEHQWSMLAGVL